MEYCQQAILRERFVNEAEIIRSVVNKHVPVFVNSKLDTNRPYYAYHYIDGISLDQILKTQKLSLSKCLDYTRQLLTILSSLHQGENAIIHSDISPDNIIVSSHGQVTLIDFGCACKLQSHADSAHTWIGKHAYLSPEQAQGLRWSRQSDLYQVGLIFYEMLIGLRRNNGKTNKDQMPIAANPAALILSGIEKHYHPFLETILSVVPDYRYQTARQALLALNKL